MSPEREDTDDCTETTEDVSGIVLSVANPPPSPSVWTDIVDWKGEKNFIHDYRTVWGRIYV